VVLAGCGTTPGVGVPTVLVSGKLAAARVTGGTPRGRSTHLTGTPRGARTTVRTAVRQTPAGVHDAS
jgi:phytoene desaturase